MRKTQRIAPFIEELSVIFSGKYPRISFAYFLQEFVAKYGDCFYFEEDDFLEKAKELDLPTYEEDLTMPAEEVLQHIKRVWKDLCPDWRFGQLLINTSAGITNECAFADIALGHILKNIIDGHTAPFQSVIFSNKQIAEYYDTLIF